MLSYLALGIYRYINQHKTWSCWRVNIAYHFVRHVEGRTTTSLQFVPHAKRFFLCNLWSLTYPNGYYLRYRPLLF